ncbi:MAG TPA: hypothetical protein VGR69_09240 [Candidatus Rubrimentiphilum sp.]|nr:hypothetical protein [Candidatus Rubrimentiphilum sp.]
MSSTPSKTTKALSAVVIVAACALLAWQLVSNGKNGAWLMGDFRAFYCGGTAVLHGVSPYAATPMLHCELAPQPFGLHTTRPGVDLPAPFPGYVLSVFVPLALLPYPLAAAFWFVLLLVATAAACNYLAQLCRRPAIIPFTLLAFALAVAVIPYGELAPFIIAALAAGSLVLRRGFSWPVIGALAVTALLPHVALPVFLTVFIYVRAARLPIVMLALFLVALDLTVGGTSLAISYFTRVLPNHAASEIGYIMQYSTAWFAQALGASDRLALLCGDISYGLMIVAGIWLSGQLAQKFRNPAFLLLIPPAFAVIGGPFVHYSEITLAFPASLLLYFQSSGKIRGSVAVAIVLIAFPWEFILMQPLLAVPMIAGTAAIATIVLSAPLRVTLRVGFGAALFCAALMALAVVYGPQIVTHAGGTLDPSLAEASWARFISEKTSSAGIVWWVGKAPTWIGLVLFAVSAALAVRGAKDLSLRGAPQRA